MYGSSCILHVNLFSKRDSKTNVNIGKDEQTKVNARKKEKNYTQEEDIFLCRAWMTTPGDPDEDTDPSSRTFWERVKEKYTSLTGNSYAVRAGKSLPQRWSRIRAAVFKFCAIYKNISDQNPNCYSEQDMVIQNHYVKEIFLNAMNELFDGCSNFSFW